MKARPWPGCVLPGASDFIDVGWVDLKALDAQGLLSLARYIGIVPMTVDHSPLTAEVLRKEIVEHAMSA
jgi:hypothetical protein